MTHDLPLPPRPALLIPLLLLLRAGLPAEVPEDESGRSTGAQFSAAVVEPGPEASFPAVAPFRPFPWAAREGRVLFGDLRLDIESLVRKPDFYLVVGGLLAAPYFIKDESTTLNRKWAGSEGADSFFELGATLGNSALPIGAAVALRFAGGESDRLSAFSSDLLRAQILSGAFTGALKGATARRRPDGSAYAFPSGHTSSAFAAAGVVVKHYGWKWGALAEVAALYVGLSRLQENRHYVSDVIGGAILGSYIAYRVTERSDEERVSVAPLVGTGSYGLLFAARF